MYSSVSEDDGSFRNPTRGDDSSVASSKRRFRHRVNSDLSEPLTATSVTSVPVDEGLGSDAGDPYFVFRADLKRKLERVDECLAEYLRVINETVCRKKCIIFCFRANIILLQLKYITLPLQDTSVNVHEFKETKRQLKHNLKSAESTLRDVLTTVQVVENSRDKFPHIDDGQLYERKSLCNTSKERLLRAREEMNCENVKLKILEDERNKAIRRSGDGLLGARNDGERKNTSFLMDSQAQASLLMQQQDETLDELGEVVVRVGEMAGNIHDEINSQNRMLSQMEEDMSDAEEQLGLVMGKLAKFLKTKDKWQLRTILALSLTVIILFLLVLYT